MTVDPIAVVILVFSAVMASAAILTFLSSRKQTDLLRRTLYGEIYEEPPLDHVGFLKPEAKYESVIKHDKRVSYNMKVEGDNYIFEEVVLPKKSKVKLAITFRTKEKQSLQHLQLGCRLKQGKEPRVVGAALWWTTKKIRALPAGEYIDLDGYYHIEYQVPRKFGIRSPFIFGFKLEAGDIGKYDFDIEIYSTEAKASFKKTLKVIVK